MLGKFEDGKSTSYDKIAQEYDAQYYNLDEWDELAKTYSRDEMWKVNEKFLDIEIASGRDIYLSHDPAKFSGDGSFFAKEIEYLRQHGYKFVKRVICGMLYSKAERNLTYQDQSKGGLQLEKIRRL